MSLSIIILIPVVFLIIVPLIISSIVITQTKKEKIVERFGQYQSTRSPGISFIIPVIDKVVKVTDMNVRSVDKTLEVKTKDNLFINYPFTVQYKVIDSKKAHYELDSPVLQIVNFVSNKIRSSVGKLDFIDLYSSATNIQEDIMTELKEKMFGYGFEITDILINQPIPTEDVQNSYNSVNSSKRKKEAAENDAEARKITMVKEAEAEKESKKLQGEGIAAQREAIAKGFKESIDTVAENLGLSNEIASAFLLQLIKQDVIRDAAKDKANIILIDSSTNTESKELVNCLAGMKSFSSIQEDKK